MSINPGGTTNYNWNYSHPDKPGYSTSLIGTVVAIQEVQKLAYSMSGRPGAPEFWPDGNPKMNIRIALATEEGELKTLIFQPAGKKQKEGKKPSLHMDLWHLTNDTDMHNLIGKTIGIMTEEGSYGQGNPRPWQVSIVEAGPFELQYPLPAEYKAEQVLADTAASGGQINAPQPQPQYQQPQYPQYSQYQQPQYQQGSGQMAPSMQQFPQGMPQMQQPMGQMAPSMQQPQAPGMNPAVMQNMQQPQPMPQQVAPVNGAVYDDIPF